IPVQDVTEISYLDVDGTPIVLDASDYRVVQGQRPYVVPAPGLSWPVVGAMPDAITVIFTAGYGDDGVDVPEPIRTAIALAAGHMRSMSARNLNITEEVEEGIGSTRYVVSQNAGEVIDRAIRNLLSTYQVMLV